MTTSRQRARCQSFMANRWSAPSDVTVSGAVIDHSVARPCKAMTSTSSRNGSLSSMKTTTRKKTWNLPTKKVADVTTFHSYAFYGRAGSGKTTLASSFPKPLLLVDVRDKGTDSIADVKGIEVLEIETLDDLEELYYALKDHPERYKSLVFDTVTELQKIVMASVIKGKSKGKKVDLSRLGDWGTMAKRDWGDVAAIMNKWIADFRDLDMHVVFLAQERTKTNDEESEDNQIAPEVGPAVIPSIASTLNAAVNVVGNTFIRTRKTTKLIKGKKVSREEEVYCLRVGPSPVYITKIR